LFNDPYSSWDDRINIDLKVIDKTPPASNLQSVLVYRRHQVGFMVVHWQKKINFNVNFSKLFSILTWQAHRGEKDNSDVAVRMVRVLPSLGLFISVSALSGSAMVIRGIDKTSGGTEYAGSLEMGEKHPKKNTHKKSRPHSNIILTDPCCSHTYTPDRYSIPRGAHAFDYSASLNLVATGGLDMQVRLWNPYVPFPPVAVFPGHLSTVVQIAFNNSYKQLISLDINETIRIWDLVELVRCKWRFNR
jgi:WD40 repeat protein